jgi:hypothetical protein
MTLGTDELWDVRVHWKAEPGATCLPYTLHAVTGEAQAIDAAVSVMDGCRHRWAPVRATVAEIRRAGDTGSWRRVGHAQSDAPMGSYI